MNDDYFNRTILKNKYFSLNNALASLSIDTIIYQNASSTIVKLTGNVSTPVAISITVKVKVLNNYDDLTSNSILVGIGNTPYIIPIATLTSRFNSISLNCNIPELLGNQIEILKSSVQLIAKSKIDNINSNKI